MTISDTDSSAARWYAETANIVLDLAPKFTHPAYVKKAKLYAMRLLDKSMEHTKLPPPDKSEN